MKLVMKYKKTITFVICVTIAILVYGMMQLSSKQVQASDPVKFWEFQSIDTMKYSRDTAREKLKDPTYDIVIERQIKDIANTGATHVGIATPYDEEFYPMLERWVKMARKYHLKVWFRGNFSGWERWFEYEKIDRATHMAKTREFIERHPDIFENGDVFSACPECENGGPGDPRMNGDAAGHKKFLIDEHKVAEAAFKKIGKNVDTRYNSMNGDVARLIMDPETTKALGGLVVVDHYVRTPEQLNEDISEYAKLSGGKVVLGEFGVPIPDINGNLSEIEQAEWLSEAMPLLSQNDDLVGLNYWTNVGGSTELWDSTGKARAGVKSLKQAYSPNVIKGTVKGVGNRKISELSITGPQVTSLTKDDGIFTIPSYDTQIEVKISAPDYKTEHTILKANEENNIVLQKIKPSLWDKFLKFLSDLRS